MKRYAAITRSRAFTRIGLSARGAHVWRYRLATEVPPRHVFGPIAARPTPYLYSPQQIRELMRRASQLPGTLQSQTYAVLLGLLACTGLRISEALGLRVADVDWVGRVLCIRESQYHKVRWVPMHSTTVRRLRTYLRQRRQ